MNILLFVKWSYPTYRAAWNGWWFDWIIVFTTEQPTTIGTFNWLSDQLRAYLTDKEIMDARINIYNPIFININKTLVSTLLRFFWLLQTLNILIIHSHPISNWLLYKNNILHSDSNQIKMKPYFHHYLTSLSSVLDLR